MSWDQYHKENEWTSKTRYIRVLHYKCQNHHLSSNKRNYKLPKACEMGQY